MEHDQEKRAPLKGLTQNRRYNVNSLRARRASLVAEVALLRDRGGASKFTDNAHQLLTRYWSTPSLGVRQNLLKSVEWLVLLERRRQGQHPIFQ